MYDSDDDEPIGPGDGGELFLPPPQQQPAVSRPPQPPAATGGPRLPERQQPAAAAPPPQQQPRAHAAPPAAAAPRASAAPPSFLSRAPASQPRPEQPRPEQQRPEQQRPSPPSARAPPPRSVGKVEVDAGELQRLRDALATAKAELQKEREARVAEVAALTRRIVSLEQSAHRSPSRFRDPGSEPEHAGDGTDGLDLSPPSAAADDAAKLGELRKKIDSLNTRGAAAKPHDGLAELSAAELRRVAADHGVDLAGCFDKDEMLGRLSVHLPIYQLQQLAKENGAAKKPAAQERREKPQQQQPKQQRQCAVGAKVRVRCVDDAGKGDERWDPATLLSYDPDGTVTVCFDDGEVWPRVAVADVVPFDDVGSGNAQAADADGADDELSQDEEESTSKLWEMERDWDPARGLPPSLRRRDVFYSGYVWRKGGWLRSGKTKQWLILVNGMLYTGNEPTDEEFESLELNGAVVTVPGDGDWQVVNKGFDVDCTFTCETPSERVLWAARVELAALQHSPLVPLQPYQLKRFREVFSVRERSIVPGCFAADKLPERAHHCHLSGYVVVRTDSGWLSRGDWGRKWVTVHGAWLSIRTDKRDTRGLRVVPLRDCNIAECTIDHDNPHNLEISGPFVGTVIVSCDGTDQLRRWRKSIVDAIARTNPERATGQRTARDHGSGVA